jgi:hypothetical protein
MGALGAALGMGPVFWSMAAILLGGGWLAGRWRRAEQQAAGLRETTSSRPRP